MWHRFDDDLKGAILRADARSKADGGRGLTTGHLLWGLATGSRAAAKVLAQLGVSPEMAREGTGRKEPAEAPAGGPEPTLTTDARDAIERAYQIAAELGDATVGGEHLLLALTRGPTESDAGRVLAQRAVSWERAGKALMLLHRHRLRPPEGVRVRGLRVRRWKKHVRSQAGRVKHLVYGLSHHRIPFMPYVLAPRRTLNNPYPFYARLRRRPAYWDPLTAQWVVTGYPDVVEALAEPRLSQRIFAASVWSEADIPPSVQQEFRRLQGHLDRQMLFLDAPDQPRQRSHVARRFTPRVIAQMRDQVQTLTDELLDAATPAGRMEVIADLAVPFPLTVIVRMLGLPPGDLARFKKWSTDYFTLITLETTLAQDLDAYRSVQEAQVYFRALIPERRHHPQADLLTVLVRPDEQGECLPEDEVVANCLLLLATGHENTTRLIGSGLLALLRRPEQWQRLRDDPSLINSAVEEMLRFDSPVQWLLRTVQQDFVWRDHALKQGQRVQIGLAAANRDPAQFPDPDRLDIARAENRHVAFGHGPHFCLGAALTRLEAQVVFSALIARFPRLRLERAPAYRHEGLAFRGLKSLHIRWDE